MADKTQEKLIEDFANATITVSPKAIERIKNAMKMEGKEGWALRTGVDGGGCSGMNYKMSFDNKLGSLPRN